MGLEGELLEVVVIILKGNLVHFDHGPGLYELCKLDYFSFVTSQLLLVLIIAFLKEKDIWSCFCERNGTILVGRTSKNRVDAKSFVVKGKSSLRLHESKKTMGKWSEPLESPEDCRR